MDISRKALNMDDIDDRVVEMYKIMELDIQNRINEIELKMRAAKEVAAIKDEIKRIDTKSYKLHERLKKGGKGGKGGKI
jgi:hypothetical protein